MNCETCRTSFDCKTLNTILAVMERHEDEIDDPELLKRFREIRSVLDKGNWKYPHGSDDCRFRHMSREVRMLTTELVKIWQASHWRGPKVDPSSLYLEETRHE